MFHTFDELAVIYNKIIDGTATEQEKCSFEITLKTGCMIEDEAMKIIKRKAKELKRQSKN